MTDEEKKTDGSATDEYRKWLNLQYGRICKEENEWTDHNLLHTMYSEKDRKKTLEPVLNSILPRPVKYLRKEKENTKDGLSPVIEKLMPIKLNEIEENDIYDEKIRAIAIKFRDECRKKNIIADNELGYFEPLFWNFYKRHDLENTDNLRYLVALLLVIMKHNREEFADDSYNPAPFPKKTEATGRDYNLMKENLFPTY